MHYDFASGEPIFANGAVTAAFAMAMSSIASRSSDTGGDVVNQSGSSQEEEAAGALSFMEDPEVIKEFNKAWDESNPYAPDVPHGQNGSLKTEQGGWIVKRSRWSKLFGEGGDYKVIRAAPGTRDGMRPGSRPSSAVGWFHTHPNTVAEGYSALPSPADIKFTNNVAKVPGVVITHEGYKFIPNP